MQATDSVSSRGNVQVTGRRVLGTLVDVVLLAVLQVILAIPFGAASAGDGGANVSLSGLPAFIFFVLVFGYYIFMEGRFGQTVGKMVVGIKVVRESDGQVPGYGGAALRTVLRIIDGLFLYLVGFIAVMVSGKNQRLGDMVAKTLVVRK